MKVCKFVPLRRSVAWRDLAWDNWTTRGVSSVGETSWGGIKAVYRQ